MTSISVVDNILRKSRGSCDTSKIVMYSGPGKQSGLHLEEMELWRKRFSRLYFGFGTVVEEAQRAINTANDEAESFDNCNGVVKLMGCVCYSRQPQCGLLYNSIINLLQDVDLWISQKIKEHFSKKQKMAIKLKYTDLTLMMFGMCTAFSWLTVPFMLILAGCTGFTVGLHTNSCGVHAHQSRCRLVKDSFMQNKLVITD